MLPLRENDRWRTTKSWSSAHGSSAGSRPRAAVRITRPMERSPKRREAGRTTRSGRRRTRAPFPRAVRLRCRPSRLGPRAGAGRRCAAPATRGTRPLPVDDAARRRRALLQRSRLRDRRTLHGRRGSSRLSRRWALLAPAARPLRAAARRARPLGRPARLSRPGAHDRREADRCLDPLLDRQLRHLSRAIRRHRAPRGSPRPGTSRPNRPRPSRGSSRPGSPWAAGAPGS